MSPASVAQANSARPAADRADRPLLRVTDLDVSYGGVRALRGVSVDVPAGSVVAVLGGNGAGKSTLLRAISGTLPYAGGVCGRKVEVTVKDHRYDPQQAVSLYRELSGSVLAMQTVLGSPVMTALRPSIGQDNMFTGFAGWSASVLSEPRIVLLGTTYDVEAISGLDYLIRQNGLKAGDKVGHVYFEGDFGENALRGSQHLAKQAGLTIVGQKIKSSDTDLSAQVTAFRTAGVKAILVSAGPTQTASVAGVARSVGLSVPIVANGPGFTPQLLDTPAGPALKANLHVVSSMAPPAYNAPAVAQLQQAFAKQYPSAPPTQVGSLFGYAQARVTKDVLQKACDNKDLTRQGLLDALHSISSLDTGGLVAGTLDYTKTGQPPGRQVYISKVDESVPGGLTVVDGPAEADAAKTYQPAA